MIGKNQVQGFVSLPILMFCLLMMGLVVGSLPFFLNTEHALHDEENYLQAQMNAEAGVWMGLQDWKEDSTSFTATYDLPSGQARVYIESVDPETISIQSFGFIENSKDGIQADYSLSKKQFIHWHKVVQQ
ncbi:MAG TPA: hypothetical protein VJ824_14755 [Bacillota bacterium]|nr:hypothetical protein [Bacillota bacterium]